MLIWVVAMNLKNKETEIEFIQLMIKYKDPPHRCQGQIALRTTIVKGKNSNLIGSRE